MKTWKNPEIEVLELKCTELGSAQSSIPDDSYVDENGHAWYSYSGGQK